MQFPHSPVSGKGRFIFHAVFQIPFYMRKTFLMCASATVKSNFMIVYQNPLKIFYYSSLYAFMPFFLTGKVKYLFLIWRYCCLEVISARRSKMRCCVLESLFIRGAVW